MKWYFAISESSLSRGDHDWPGLIKTAVQSALMNTTLTPHLLYDGQPNELTHYLEKLGVKIVPHRVCFFKELESYGQQTSRHESWLGIASGAFLRLDIPLLEREDDLVLYTDTDVIFLNELNFYRNDPPTFFAASPQFGENYDDMNSGVMLINVPAMRADHANLVRFTINNFDLGLDQEVLREHYANRYDMLDRSLNWKPYWGHNPNAQIIHFHGPKPVAARKFLNDKSYVTNETWLSLLQMSREGYQLYLDIWDKYAGPDHATCTIDYVSSSLVTGWAMYQGNPFRRVELKVLLDGEDDGSILCDQPRPDVAKAGFGSGRFGFRYALPDHLAGGPIRTVKFIDATGASLDMIIKGETSEYCLVPSPQ